MSGPGNPLTTDEALDLLSNARRRFVIQYLADEESQTDLTKLAEQTAAWENGVPPSAITDDGRRRTYISLYQTHLPRLEDADVVSYDEDQRTVELTENAEAIGDSLPTPTPERRWASYYLVVGAVGLVGLLGSVPVAASTVGIGLAVAVILLAAGQYLGEQRRGQSVLASLVD